MIYKDAGDIGFSNEYTPTAHVDASNVYVGVLTSFPLLISQTITQPRQICQN
jgi:hypothetical protein